MTANPRILIVEDEADLLRVMEYNLQQSGFDTKATGSAQEALRLAESFQPDAVLMDLMLPDGSGLDTCRSLKSNAATRTIPVIIVTAKGEEIDRVVGFELGADDYVVKPFSVRELALRVRAVLRRSESQPGAVEMVSFGKLRIDRSAHRVFVDRVEIPLTALEFRLLTTLFDRKNRVQSRETLLEDVWNVHAEIETRTVDTHIKRLREKLGAAGVYVHTVRGVGYRFADSPDEAE